MTTPNNSSFHLPGEIQFDQQGQAQSLPHGPEFNFVEDDGLVPLLVKQGPAQAAELAGHLMAAALHCVSLSL